MADDLQAQITEYQAELHDLALAMAQARAAGQDDAAAALKQQFDALTQVVNGLVGQQQAAETPSSFSLGLANVGEELATVVRNGAMILGVLVVAVLVGPRLLAAAKARRARG